MLNYYAQTPIMTPSQLKRLDGHKYNCTNESIMDAFMQKWWNTVIQWTPMWVAPNAITMIGLIVNILTSLILMYFCPTAKEPCPRWAALLCGFGLFIYQTLDAIDGKQARRTNTISPMGELFDHGCDSVSTVFVSIASSCVVSLGHYPYSLMLQCFLASFLFYSAHWQTYVTGTMRFGKFDVTEGQMSVMAMMFITAIFGPQIWDISVIGVSFRYLPSMFAFTMGCIAFLGILNKISDGGVGRNGSTVAGTSIIAPVIHIGAVLLSGLYVAKYSVEDIFENNPIIFVILFGLMATKVTNKLIVAHMSKSEIWNPYDLSFLVPLVFFANRKMSAKIPETYLLTLGLIFISVDLYFYSSAICMEICNHMRLHLFKITDKSKKSE
ncbi:choline/ethanolaminephosphotransferase 1-like [Tigriopus californicus]|uniref:choline/ethanolaminephosphotransferase 1-like n=1 Tax=Tigriopus californicus TaxID=6832 RepID=UPI0027DA806B|nr:choline/ethanolaminephosphotransferase 1-like [Tigriopus californicus]